MKRRAFTLAEVLITLGIIGIVAAMTIPTLISKYQEKSTISRLNKIYSTLAQAYTAALYEHGNISSWYSGLGESPTRAEYSSKMMDYFTETIKANKKCYQEQGCFANTVYKTLSGSDLINYDTNANLARIITADGVSLGFNSYGRVSASYGTSNALQKTYGTINVDINGTQEPNTFGMDMFSFFITENAIIPLGTPEMTNDTLKFPAGCNLQDCKSYCESCAAWIIQNKNMDYLHCNDLSWDGKHTCK